MAVIVCCLSLLYNIIDMPPVLQYTFVQIDLDLLVIPAKAFARDYVITDVG